MTASLPPWLPPEGPSEVPVPPGFPHRGPGPRPVYPPVPPGPFPDEPAAAGGFAAGCNLDSPRTGTLSVPRVRELHPGYALFFRQGSG